jgi:hypothetical protein
MLILLTVLNFEDFHVYKTIYVSYLEASRDFVSLSSAIIQRVDHRVDRMVFNQGVELLFMATLASE